MDYTAIKSLRKTLGVTQDELSQIVGISTGIISHLENGKRDEVKNGKRRRALQDWMLRAIRKADREKNRIQKMENRING